MSDTIAREGLLSAAEVLRLTTLSRREMYRRIAAGTFPVAVHLGAQRRAWPAGEVLDWIAALPRSGSTNRVSGRVS